MLLAGLASALLAAVPAFAGPEEIASKQEEVQHVLAQIEGLDSSLGKAIEVYNEANVRLQGIESEQTVNRHDLKVARANLKHQQAALAGRLVAVYKGETDVAGLGVLLGATSLDDLVDRFDTIKRVSDQDSEIVHEVKQFRSAVLKHKRQLVSAHTNQADLVQQRAEQKASIESQLAERRQLVDSIRSEIQRLEAEERARQERLAREAAARLAAQRAAEEAAREQAAEIAAAQEAAAAAPSTEATTATGDSAGSSDTGGSQATTDTGASGGSGDAGDSATSDYVPPDEAVGVVAETPDATVAPPPSHSGDVVGIAMQYLGVPYVWGGADPSGFDCSGFVLYVYAQVGVSLPHYTGDQWNMGVPVSRDQLEPGDLVFFNGLGHMGMYIGGGQFIHSPHTGDVVKISSLSDSWYASTYEGARRIL